VLGAERGNQGTVDARRIADRYEIFISQRVLGWLPRIRSETELPYPKAVIQAVLEAAISSAPCRLRASALDIVSC